MNKIKITGILLLIFIYMGCATDCCLYKTSAKIYLINESSSVVKASDVRNCFDYVLQPGETIIHNESSENESSKKPTSKTYQPFGNCYIFKYLENSKCEVNLRNIESFENVKEVSDLNFELTFRFTDEKKENAEICN